MNLGEGGGSSYRLLVSIDGRCALADDQRYPRFDQAQSRVATAVLRHARAGRIESILLQRGRPLETTHRPAMPTPAGDSTLAVDDGHEWIVEKRWGPEVVKRILEQNGLPYTPSVAASRPSGLRARARRYVSMHRNTRWHIVGTAAVVALMIVTALLIQTGGRIDEFFTPSATGGVKTELPFDANADFQAFEAPAAGEPPHLPRSSAMVSSTETTHQAGAVTGPATSPRHPTTHSTP